ncbi:MAG: DUF3800 domain-containing protein [Chloroflexi bacterium]|nr:DUF3800 domain-containing protein [Chloroflexota bacterium]
MLTFTFAGDESGDASFDFGKGASRHFVIAMIATSSPDNLRAMLEKTRKELNLAERYEFGFHKLHSEKLRQKIFVSLSQMDFEAWAILVDKTTLGKSFRAMTGLERYLFFVAELIRCIPEEKRFDGTLILDEFGYPNQTKNELKRILKALKISSMVFAAFRFDARRASR